MAVLSPFVHPSENLFACSGIKIAPPLRPVSTGLHPLLRIVSSLARDYMNRLALWYQCQEIVVRPFLNLFKHVYIVLRHSYLFHHLSTPCPTLLLARMQRSFLFKHDFRAQMLKLSRKMFYPCVNCLQIVAFNCFPSSRVIKRDSPSTTAWRFRQGRWRPFRCFPSPLCLNIDTKPPVVCRVGIRCVGGGSPCGISWTSLSAFARSTPDTFDTHSTLCYAAHIHEDDSTLTLHPTDSTKSPAYAPKDLRDPETDKPIFLQPHAFDSMFEPHTLTCVFCKLIIVSNLNILFLVLWKPLQTLSTASLSWTPPEFVQMTCWLAITSTWSGLVQSRTPSSPC